MRTIRLLVLFTALPLLELFLLIRIGTSLGAAATIGIVLASGAVGAILARRQGFSAWLRVQYEMQQGIFPANSLVDGLLILIASVLLITPGIITDAVGFLALIPGTRRPIRNFLIGKLRRMFDAGDVGLKRFFDT